MFPLSALMIAIWAYCGVCHAAAVVKRSDDVTPLETVVARLSSDLQAVQARLTSLTNKVDHNSEYIDQHVGFTVGLKTDVSTNIRTGMTLNFDNVFYNAGNAYDPVDGHFLAPVSGTYVFYFKTEVAHDKTVGLDLYREGHGIAHIFTGGSSTYETAGDLEVVHLNKGERIWVVKSGGSDGYLRGGHATRFSGFLLNADQSTP